MKTFVLTTLLLSFSFGSFAQNETTVLTLDECIDFALENNIALKRAKNGELIADANEFQSLMNFLPSLSAGINYDYFFGNFFDTNAARQVSETSNSSNPNVSASIMLFNGFSNQYARRRMIEEQKAAQAGTDEAELGVRANILLFFLNVAIAEEDVKISNDRVDLLVKQLDREEKRVSVGVGSMEAVYSIKSQLADERLSQTNAKNAYSSNMLSLLQEMQLDPSVPYAISSEEIDDEQMVLDLEPFDQILSESLSSHPGMRRVKSSKESSRFLVKEAASGRLPTLSAFGRIGSNYSSNGARNPTSGDFEENASFNDQLGYNQFEYINFSLNVPIFNQFRASRNVQVSKIGLVNAELDYSQQELAITNTVQQAYLDMLNAQSSYKTAKENLQAQTAALDFIKTRFDAGNTDFYSYFESLNNQGRARAQMINAKYSLIFRKRILDLFRGI